MRCLILLLSVLLFSCAEESTAPTGIKKEGKPKTTIREAIKPEKDGIITNRNVVERLTKYGKEHPETIVLIRTDFGDIKVRLYKDTPLHRANFLLMTSNGCFNNTVFTRVSKQFMAQAGGTYDEAMVDKRNRIGRYTIPAEILPKYHHKQGALASARSYNDNPDKRSSSFQFYFVEGSTYNNLTLDKYEEENRYLYPPAHRQYYLNNPGAAHLDGQHTVFGEIIDGYPVIPKITHVKTDSRDWPVTDIFIREVLILE